MWIENGFIFPKPNWSNRNTRNQIKSLLWLLIFADEVNNATSSNLKKYPTNCFRCKCSANKEWAKRKQILVDSFPLALSSCSSLCRVRADAAVECAMEKDLYFTQVYLPSKLSSTEGWKQFVSECCCQLLRLNINKLPHRWRSSSPIYQEEII